MEYARAIFPFQATQGGDLSFEEDQIILILKKNNNGWWTGVIGSGNNKQQGEFPFNYVELISAEEAQRAMGTMGGGGMTDGAQGDRVVQVEVNAEKQSVKYKIQLTLATGAAINGSKTIGDFRTLDSVLKAIFPNFDGILPPMWADNAYFSDESSFRRGRILQSYLKKLRGNDVTEFAMVAWLNPNAKFNTSPQARSQVEQGYKQAAAVSRTSFRAAMQNAPALARVAYNWQPHDAVELELRKGEVIAVLSRQTLSPGWWEGQTAEGLKGLFPYNHVQALSETEAHALVLGKKVDTGKLQAVDALPVKKKEEVKPSRKVKIEKPFAIGSMESFDALLIDGFTMEKDGRLVTDSNTNCPGQGDFVSMSYIGYVWDCQEQQIVEFASSDLPDRDGNVGNMEFTMGSGQVIKGIELAAGFMEKGQSVRLVVKPELAYGDVGFPQLNIPPNVHLVYDISLVDFDTSLPGPPTEMKQESNPGKAGVPRTLAEAVALQAKRAGSVTQTYQPIQNRAGRGHGNQMKGYKAEPNTGGVVLSANGGGGAAGGGGGGVKKPKQSPPRQYDLHKMREIARLKAFDEYGVQPAFLEESLTDQAFYEAFRCDRSAFILMPRWKQMKMKKEAGLF